MCIEKKARKRKACNFEPASEASRISESTLIIKILLYFFFLIMRAITFFSAATLLSSASAADDSSPLRFRSDGTFKVVEVSDTHFTRNLFCNDLSPAQERYPCSDENATAFWRKIIVEEDPDLFLFTGDNVCSGNVFGGADSIEGLLKDWQPGGSNAHVPFVAVEG